MSGATDTSSPMLKRSNSPRPPAIGEEVKRFHDTPHKCPEQYKNWNMDCISNSKAACLEPADQSVTSCIESVTDTIDCTEKSPNPSPPAALKWAQSLQCLLEDNQGVSLYKEFLEQDGQENYLSCWLAMSGVKKIDPCDWELLINSIKIVFKMRVKRISAISGETKEEIKQKLSTNVGLDNTVFDKALQEIKAYMMKTTYPNFLKSDLYIQHLGGWQNELSPEKERIVISEPVEQLPTVHEDSELYIPSKFPVTKTNLLQRNKSSYTSKFKAEASSGLLRSPYSYGSYHAKYSAYLPVSAQDSEIQSLSSDAQTDDTMSLTDGSNVDYPTHSRTKHKRPQKVWKHMSNPIYNAKDKSNPQIPINFIPRTERLPETKQLNQDEFHAALVKALNKVVEERKKVEKFSEKLKVLEGSEPQRPDEISYFPAPSDASAHQHHKVNQNTVFAPAFIAELPEENVQDILDQHISRVFDSGQQTPAGVLSPTVPRPSSDLEKSRVPVQGSSNNELSDYPSKHGIKYRKDHDTYSLDSAVYPSDDNLPIDYSRRYKDHSKRYPSRKFSSVAADSGSSCFDSGISVISETVPSYSKVTHWLETKRMADQEREQHSWRNSSTSPVLSRSSSSRKTVHNSCRGGSQDTVYSQWSGAPAQQYSHDISAPGFSASDTTSNLVEARRRLEDENRVKQRMNRKPNRKSPSLNVIEAASANNPPSNDVTVIGYSYGRHAVPYLSKMPGKNITLRQFKSMLSKKGNFRYFFKTASDDFGTGVVFEEVTEDSKVLPLWEGKVFCVIESMDDNSVM